MDDNEFNRIENHWEALGHDLYRSFPPTDTLTDLEIALQLEWRLI